MKDDAIHNLLVAFAQGQTDFDNVLIKHAKLQAQFLPFVSFRRASMPEADFRHSILPGANFEGAMLKRSNFEHANLLATNLAWAHLNQANLGHVLLASSILVGANLANANLAGASMPGVNLTSANLRNANLSGANLRGANLSKANLFGARIDAKALAEAVLEFTIMPDGQCVSSPAAEPSTEPANQVISSTHMAIPLAAPGKEQAAPPATSVTDTTKPMYRRTAAQSNRKHIWFQFTENSSDLDLRLASSPEL